MQRPLQMDTTEQVLPLPPHSEVLPFLPRVSPARRVRHMCAHWHAARRPVPSRQRLSLLFLHPSGGGGNKIQPFNFSSLLWLNHDPHFSSTVFFFLDSFDFSLSFPSLIFLCLEIRSKVWETGRRCCAVPIPGGQRQKDVRLLPGLGRRVLRVAGVSQLPELAGLGQWGSW